MINNYDFYIKNLEKKNDLIKLNRFIFFNNPVEIIKEIIKKDIKIISYVWKNKNYKKKYINEQFILLDFIEIRFREELKKSFNDYFEDEEITKFILKSTKINLLHKLKYTKEKNKNYNDEPLPNYFRYISSINGDPYNKLSWENYETIEVKIWFHHTYKPMFFSEFSLKNNNILFDEKMFNNIEIQHKYGFSYNNIFYEVEVSKYKDNITYIENCLTKHIQQIITKKERGY